ncbi:ATP-binding protein [Streptomyces murinus]|uniref:ATP-binding protein n=1 Tax=Streptomyces murinus TaxID=33900 RepID=UPI00382D18F8
MLAIDLTGTRATAVLFRNARAAALARRLIKFVSTGSTAPTDTALLLLSELVSNAARHTNGLTIKVTVTCDEGDGTITGAVFDTSTCMSDGPRCRDDASDELETGRGLDILDALADKWGVTKVSDHGKWVWFRVSAPGRSLSTDLQRGHRPGGQTATI